MTEFVNRMDQGVRESVDRLLGTLSFLRSTGLDNEQRAAIEGAEQSTREILMVLDQFRDRSAPVVQEPPVKLEVLEETTGGDLELQQDLIVTFTEDSIEGLRALEEALIMGDLQRVRKEAHSLKGSAPYFGADAFSRAAQALEDVSVKGDAVQAKVFLRECELEFEKVREFLEQHLSRLQGS